MAMVNDQLFTPLLAYVSILNTVTSYERQNGAASYAVRGTAAVKEHGMLSLRGSVHAATQPSSGAAAYIVAPINFILRNAFEDVELEGLNLEIDASEQPRSATLERVWVDGTRVKAGHDGRPEDAAPHVSRRGHHAHRAGGDPGQRARRRLDHGGRRARGSRSARRGSCRSSRCRRAGCRR